MCVGITAMVEKIEDGMATVTFSGAKRKISVELIKGLKPGDYVMIHAGIAIARVTAEEGEETQAIMEELYGGR